MRTASRKLCWSLPLFMLALAADGCVNAKLNVPIGTTTAELQAKFGPPLYREPAEKGRQLWFYDVTFEHVRKYHDIAPATVDATGQIDPGGDESVTAHTYESHPSALVISRSGVVIDVPDGHVNRTQ